MSQQATEVALAQLENADKADFDATVEDIAAQCDVSEDTAAAYIYQMEEVEHKWTAGGDHIIQPATAGGEQSVLQGFDGDAGELKMEPGEETGKRFKHLPVLEDVGHPLVPDETPYFSRRLEGHKTDLQVFTYDLAADEQPGVQHLLLTGLPGVGKNQAIKKICAETNRAMIRIPVGGGIRYEDLVGHYTPTKDGDLEWTDGILTTAARYGFFVVLDEVDMMTGDVSSPLHQITEDDPELVIRQTGEVIDPHPQFRVAATRNPNFAGSSPMNRAFQSRFSEHTVDYLNASAEAKVLANEVDGVDEDDVRPIVDYAGDLRERYPQEIDLVVTTRDLKRVAGYMAGDMFDVKGALRKVLLPRADPDTDRGPLADEIDTRF